MSDDMKILTYLHQSISRPGSVYADCAPALKRVIEQLSVTSPGDGQELRDLVTRESALSAIQHVAESKVPGKTIRAAHMLVSAMLQTQGDPLAQYQLMIGPSVVLYRPMIGDVEVVRAASALAELLAAKQSGKKE